VGRLILVRHGESVGNRDRIFAVNPAELPLTERGYQQARAVAERIGALFNAELLVASPFVRARETARVIADTLRLPLEIEPDLYERDVGSLQGQSYDLLSQAPGYDLAAPWRWKPEGGESYEDVRNRVAPILDRLAKAHPQRDVVIVSHGGVMVTLWAYVTGDWRLARTPHNCGVVVIEHGPEGYLLPQPLDDAGEAADAGG